jgi:hypothetical protein
MKELHDCNLRIADLEDAGDREELAALLAPTFVMRRASGSLVDRDVSCGREAARRRCARPCSIDTLDRAPRYCARARSRRRLDRREALRQSPRIRERWRAVEARRLVQRIRRVTYVDRARCCASRTSSSTCSTVNGLRSVKLSTESRKPASEGTNAPPVTNTMRRSRPGQVARMRS